MSLSFPPTALARAITAALSTAAVVLVAPAQASAAPELNATYIGAGLTQKGAVGILTGSDGGVAAYVTIWHRTICGIKHFSLSFGAVTLDQEIPVDADGNFHERFRMRYPYRGKTYQVRAESEGQIAFYAHWDGYPDDQVWVQQTVKVRPNRPGARWCAVQMHEFIGFRKEAPANTPATPTTPATQSSQSNVRSTAFFQ